MIKKSTKYKNIHQIYNHILENSIRSSGLSNLDNINSYGMLKPSICDSNFTSVICKEDDKYFVVSLLDDITPNLSTYQKARQMPRHSLQ